ncbi:hypothetical protein Tco_1340970, partial [Tanacetum coccineum]
MEKDNAPNMFSIRIHHGGSFRRYPCRRYVDGHVDMFDMVDIDLFRVIVLNRMVLQLGGCLLLDTLVRSFKLLEVYIEHGYTVVNSYQRPPPQVGAIIEDITERGTSEAFKHGSDKMLSRTWHDSSTSAKESVCDYVTPRSLPQDDSSTPSKDSVCESATPICMPHGMLTPITDEFVIMYTQLSGVQGVDIQNHVLSIIQSQFSDINMSCVTQQPTTSQVKEDVM